MHTEHAFYYYSTDGIDRSFRQFFSELWQNYQLHKSNDSVSVLPSKTNQLLGF